VALNLYDLVVRRPNKPTEKYGLRAYDEIILAPMVRYAFHGTISHNRHLITMTNFPIQCIFEPRVIEFDRKRIHMRTISHPDITEEIIEHATDHVVSAEVVCSQVNFQAFNRPRL
jgi:actin-related protein 8